MTNTGAEPITRAQDRLLRGLLDGPSTVAGHDVFVLVNRGLAERPAHAAWMVRITPAGEQFLRDQDPVPLSSGTEFWEVQVRSQGSAERWHTVHGSADKGEIRFALMNWVMANPGRRVRVRVPEGWKDEG